MKKNTSFVFFFVTLMLWGCGGGGNTPGPDAGGDNVTDTPAKILSFSVVPENAQIGEQARYAFSVEGNVSRCTIDVRGDGSEVLTVPDCATRANLPVVFDAAGEYEAKFIVEGAGGGTATATFSHRIFGGPLDVSWITPARESVSGEQISLEASIRTELEIQSATLFVGDTEYPLTLSDDRLLVELPSDQIPQGRYLARLVVVDIQGNTYVSTRTITIDRPPVLTVLSPQPLSVATPSVFVQARCDDGDGSDSETDITVRLNNDIVDIDAEAGELLTLDRDGAEERISFICSDGVNRAIRKDVTVFSETSQALREVLSIDGRILAADANRVAFETFGANGGLRLLTRADALETAIPIALSETWKSVLLTNTGAILTVRPVTVFSGQERLFDFNNGEYIEIADGGVTLIGVQSDFALYKNPQGLFRYQFSNQQSTLITTTPDMNHQVYADGTVIFGVEGDLFSYRNGVTTTLVDTGTHTGASLPTGVEFAFQTNEQQIALLTGDDLIFLGASGLASTEFSNNNGWTAYGLADGFFGQTNYRTRSPQGDDQQRSFLGQSTSLQGISSQGSLLLRGTRLVFVDSFNAAIDMASNRGTGLFIDDVPHLFLGRSLFELDISDAVPLIPDISIRNRELREGDIVGVEFRVDFSLSSAFDIVSLAAEIAGREFPAEFSQANNASVRVLLDGLPEGQYGLVIRVTDAVGNIEELTTQVYFDQAPELVVSEPLNGSVVFPDVLIDAECTATGSEDVDLRIEISSRQELTIEGGRYDQSIDLTDLEGRSVDIEVICIEELNGRKSFIEREVHVDGTPGLVETLSVDGPILDFDQNRVVYRAGDESRRVSILNRNTRGITTLPPYEEIRRAFLIPDGIAIQVRETSGFVVYELRDGIINRLSNLAAILFVEGDYGVFLNQDSQRVLRQFSTGLEQTMPPDTRVGSLIEDGRVVAVVENLVQIFEDGNLTAVTSDPNEGILQLDANQDSIVYSSNNRGLILNENGQESVLAVRAVTRQEFAENFGIFGQDSIAFTRIDATGVLQTWVRTNGSESQVSFFGTDSIPLAVHSTGDAALFSRGLGRKQLLANDEEVLVLNAGEMLPQWINGELVLQLGRSIFSFDRNLAQAPSLTGEIVINPVDSENFIINGSALPIRVTFGSDFEIVSATAEFNGDTNDLVLQSNGCATRFNFFSCYTTVFDVQSLPAGDYSFVVTLIDTFGNREQIENSFTIDRPPVLTVNSPALGNVAQSEPFTFLFDGSCDDDRSAEPTIEFGSYRPSSNTYRAIATDLSLGAAIEIPESGLYEFRCVDEVGNVTSIRRELFAEGSDELIEDDSVDGIIVNTGFNRHLALRQTPVGDSSIALYDIDGNLDQEFLLDGQEQFVQGLVTPTGAQFAIRSSDTTSVFEWMNNSLIEGVPELSFVLGDYGTVIEDQQLSRRQFSSGEIIFLASNVNTHQLSENGLVVWNTLDDRGQVFAFSNGTIQQISAPDENATGIVTNGADFVYTRVLDRADSAEEYELILTQNGQNEVLTQSVDFRPRVAFSQDFIAFTQPGNLGQSHVFRRDPDTSIQQLTFFGRSSFINQLAPTGDVLIRTAHPTIRNQFERFIVTDQEPVRFATDQGKVFWANDSWFVVIGDSVFRYQPNQ